MDRPEMIQGLTNNHFKNISKWIQTTGLSLDLPHQRHQPGLNPAPSMEFHAIPLAAPPRRSGRSDAAGHAATGSPGFRAGEAKEGALGEGAGCL